MFAIVRKKVGHVPSKYLYQHIKSSTTMLMPFFKTNTADYSWMKSATKICFCVLKAYLPFAKSIFILLTLVETKLVCKATKVYTLQEKRVCSWRCRRYGDLGCKTVRYKVCLVGLGWSLRETTRDIP